MKVFVICDLSLFLHSGIVSAQATDLPGWSIAYGDGRVTTHVLKPKGGMWTPLFPKLDARNIAASGPAKYLDIQYVTEGDDLVATISLATDGFRDRVRVARVRVRSGEPVAVEELTKYGVAPIKLAVVSIGPVQAYPPFVSEPSGQLLVRVEPRPNTPIYRFEVVNQSGRALRAFDFEAYEGDTRTLTGRRKTERNEPLILPDQQFAFDLSLGNREGEPWRTIDRIVITSVLWDDGTVDGRMEPAIQERLYARSRAEKLRALVNALAKQDAGTVETLGAIFTALDRSDRALENAREEALAALSKLQGAGDTAIKSWVSAAIAEYSAWLARCERAARE